MLKYNQIKTSWSRTLGILECMLKFDRLGTSLIDLLHSKHQVLLKSNGLVKKIC